MKKYLLGLLCIISLVISIFALYVSTNMDGVGTTVRKWLNDRPLPAPMIARGVTWLDEVPEEGDNWRARENQRLKMVITIGPKLKAFGEPFIVALSNQGIDRTADNSGADGSIMVAAGPADNNGLQLVAINIFSGGNTWMRHAQFWHYTSGDRPPDKLSTLLSHMNEEVLDDIRLKCFPPLEPIPQEY